MSAFLIDTNVFSEVFKGNRDVIDFISDIEAYVDTTVYIECIQGSKSNLEKAKIKKVLASFPLLPINKTVSELAISLEDQYSNSHGLLLADALIASSALSVGLTIMTFNISDFHFIKNLNCSLPI